MVEHPSAEEMQERLRRRSHYEGSTTPTAVLREERDGR